MGFWYGAGRWLVDRFCWFATRAVDDESPRIRAFRAKIPTYRARFTRFSPVLLTLFAIAIGSLIGRARGGRWSGVNDAELRSTPLLVIAIAAVLVQLVLNPVFPVIWSIVGAISLIAFGMRNRHLAGMSIVIIGTVLNVLPLLANWATPVSELALTSVGDLDPFGNPDISGARESSSEATRLTFLGDAIPVPVFGAVVSIGDIIALVGIADIFTNLFIRARSRELSLADAGVSFDTPQHALVSQDGDEPVSILSPLETGSRKSTDAERRRPRRNKAAPVSHTPAHAAPADLPIADSSPAEPSRNHVPAHAIMSPTPVEPIEPIVIDLSDSPAPKHAAPGELVDSSRATSSHGATPSHGEAPLTGEADPDRTHEAAEEATATNPAPTASADPIVLAGIHAVPVTPTVEEIRQPEPVPELIDLTDPDDPRPIIDLTKSPTDEQMTEFLRRRKAADRDHTRINVRPPGQRRGRAPVRLRADNAQGVVETGR